MTVVMRTLFRQSLRPNEDRMATLEVGKHLDRAPPAPSAATSAHWWTRPFMETAPSADDSSSFERPPNVHYGSGVRCQRHRVQHTGMHGTRSPQASQNRQKSRFFMAALPKMDDTQANRPVVNRGSCLHHICACAFGLKPRDLTGAPHCKTKKPLTGPF